VLLRILREQKNRKAKQLLSQLAGTICVNQYTEGRAATKKTATKICRSAKICGNQKLRHSIFYILRRSGCSSVQLLISNKQALVKGHRRRRRLLRIQQRRANRDVVLCFCVFCENQTVTKKNRDERTSDEKICQSV
jgi:hypothetical protein